MIPLHERLPDRITVNGKTYRLYADFRNVLRMLETLDNPDMMQEARVYHALKHVIKRPPRNDKRCAELLKEVRKLLFDEAKETGEQRLTSFRQDADLIRGAFRQSYGIDLFREKLHWLEFKCLLSSLPEGTRYAEVIGIRARPMPKPTKYNAEERRALAKAKAAYKIEMDDREIASTINSSIAGIASFLKSVAQGGG